MQVDPNKQARNVPRITPEELEEDVALVTISRYEEKEFSDRDGKQTRASLYFDEFGELPLRLNKTQTEWLVDRLGPDSDAWTGQVIPIEKHWSEMNGKRHHVVWVSPPESWDEYLGTTPKPQPPPARAPRTPTKRPRAIKRTVARKAKGKSGR